MNSAILFAGIAMVGVLVFVLAVLFAAGFFDRCECVPNGDIHEDCCDKRCMWCGREMEG